MAQKKPRELAEGDAVRLADREANAADVKSQLYFPHYRGLAGTITKLYADGTANVNVAPESLPTEIRARHQAGTDAMRQKWLDGLSDEARNKLSSSEKKFALRYHLLVAVSDLSLTDAPTPTPQTALAMDDAGEPVRKSSAELEAAEARHLAEVARKSKA